MLCQATLHIVAHKPQGNNGERSKKRAHTHNRGESIENSIKRHTFAPLFNLIKYWICCWWLHCVTARWIHTVNIAGVWLKQQVNEMCLLKNNFFVCRNILFILFVSPGFRSLSRAKFWRREFYFSKLCTHWYTTHTFFNLPFCLQNVNNKKCNRKWLENRKRAKNKYK